ncbi:MAG: type transport system permease protein [Tepidanaerobacteraceae bacterium]|nr:type transport system permease protein [Tepidanaerobacteraceae bacterium]
MKKAGCSLLWKAGAVKVRLYNMIKTELKSLTRQPFTMFILFGGPILLTLLFGGVYVHNYLEDIPMAVLDEDNSSMSRAIIQYFDENERFYIKYYCTSEEELKKIIDSRKVYMGLYIPRDFSKDINELKSSSVLILVDGTNMVIGNNAYASAANIVQTLAAGAQIKLLEAKGMLPRQAENMAMVFRFNDRILYDPRLTYMNYLILGFVAVFLQQVMVSSLGVSVIDNGEYLADEFTLPKLIIKIVTFALFCVPSIFISTGIAHTIFRVPLRGNLLTALLMCTVFVFAISCPSVVLAAAVRDKLKLYQLSFMLSLPTFVSSGYVWPMDQMPPALPVVIKALWPLAFFHKPFADVIFKGVPFEAVSKNIAGMLLYTFCWMPVAVLLLKKRFNRNDSLDSRAP